MDDGFKPCESLRIAEDLASERGTINPKRTSRAGKCRFDRREQRTAGTLQAVNCGVGVKNGDTKLTQHQSDRRLAHADGTSETQDKRTAHVASILRRSESLSRGGIAPKNRRNA